VVITIESLKGEDVSQLATRWAQTWGIGQARRQWCYNSGGKAERKIAINPGYGLEDRLTAGIGGEIIRNIILLNSNLAVTTMDSTKEQML
jgi:uncharacterized protein